MNVGMHCSINQQGLLQEVAEIGDPSVDPSSLCAAWILLSLPPGMILSDISAWALLVPPT